MLFWGTPESTRRRGIEIMTKRFALTPGLTCPELDGYKLPEIIRSGEENNDELEQLSLDMGKEFFIGGNYDFENGVRKGYAKAREKYEFTESQLMQALSMAFMAIQDGGDITSDEIIASLRTPRIPIAIEVEMEYTCCKRYINCIGCDATEDMVKPIHPATHPDGTVKGRWVCG